MDLSKEIHTFRKKPVTISAIKWDGTNYELAKAFFGKDYKITNLSNLDGTPMKGDLMIETLEGNMRVSLGDYIIKGVKGEFYPCKPDIFEQTYEIVE